MQNYYVSVMLFLKKCSHHLRDSRILVATVHPPWSRRFAHQPHSGGRGGRTGADAWWRCGAAMSSVPAVLLTLILSHLHPAFFILWNMVFGDLSIIKWIYSNFLMCFLQGILL